MANVLVSPVVGPLISGVVSFCIAVYGWSLLDKRANRTAKRSETFSLISHVVSILNEFEDMAEKQFKEHISYSNCAGPIPLHEQCKNSQKNQLVEAKFLARFSLFRERLEHLKSRNIIVPDGVQIAIKQSMTLGVIDDPVKYQIALSATQEAQQELYSAFENCYQEVSRFRYFLSRLNNETLLLFGTIPLLVLPSLPAILVIKRLM